MKYILKNPCKELGFTAASIKREYISTIHEYRWILRTEGKKRFNIPFATLQIAMNYAGLSIQSKPVPEWEGIVEI